MTMLYIDQELEASSDLEVTEHAIEKQKQVLEYLEGRKHDLLRKIRHLRYRRQMERETTTKVVTGEDNA